MKIIKTQQDIRILRKAEVVPDDYLNYVENYFYQFHRALGDDYD